MTTRTTTALPAKSTSLWMDTSEPPGYGRLTADARADVCVIGAGITGLTAALALAEAGRQVIVLEAGEVGAGVTGHTTGKVTALHGLFYADLESRWSADAAHVYAAAQQHAINHIRSQVARHEIDCALRTRAAYTYVVDPADRPLIEAEVAAAQRAGLPVELTQETGLSYHVEAAVRLRDQAEFHARNYLLGLAAAVEAAGGRVLQQSMATGLTERGRPPAVHVGERRVEADEVIVASHMPFLDRGGYFVRLTAKRSYAIAVRTAGPVPDGMFISAGRAPTRSVRAHPGGDGGEWLVIGGEGHAAGEHGDRSLIHYQRLAEFAREHFDVTEITHRWSSQDLQPADGLPYVGRYTPLSRHTWVAAGYRKWGLTGGTAAALALVDRMEGKPSALASLLDSWRVTPRKSAAGLIQEGLKDGRHMIGDRLRRPRRGAIDDLEPGEGALMEHRGQTVAASRDLDGTLHAVSPVCTHLGCRVLWNQAERSWDCPCHGSRFAGDGGVLEGPATAPLEDRLT